MAIVISATDSCSPVARSISISRCEGDVLTSLARSISSSVLWPRASRPSRSVFQPAWRRRPGRRRCESSARRRRSYPRISERLKSRRRTNPTADKAGCNELHDRQPKRISDDSARGSERSCDDPRREPESNRERRRSRGAGRIAARRPQDPNHRRKIKRPGPLAGNRVVEFFERQLDSVTSARRRR